MPLVNRALESFLAVAETGSFTKAAQRVHRTQSAVSQQVAHLEAELGQALFHRGKYLTLTNQGEIFLSYTRKILSLQWELLDRFREPDLAGEVNFGLPEDFATVLLADVLVDFTRIHPRVLLNIECDLTLHLYERFKNDEFDLVLVKMSQPEDFPNGIEVWSEKLVWVAHAQALPRLQEEAPLPLVLAPQPCVYRARALHALETIGRPWQIVYSSPSYSGTIAAVTAGLGFTVLPQTMVPTGLQRLNPKQLPSLSDTHISLLKHDPENRVVQTFEAFVLASLQH